MRRIRGLIAAAFLATAPALAYAEVIEGGSKQTTNWSAISMFVAFVLLTLGITYWAASRTKSAAQFYSAGGGITGFQNGIAISGDYL